MSRSSLVALVVLALSAPARAAEVTVPVDVGVGPAVHLLTGPLQDEQLLHYGLKLSVAAILDNATLRANQNRIPAKYRDMVLKMEEVRMSPSIFIPDTLFLSPKIDHAQMWGVSWAPIKLGFALARRPVRFWVGAALRLTYAYIDSDTLGTTHFLRPGVDLTADLEIPFTDTFLVSLGWTSQFYIPQRVGGPILETGALDESLWHLGQGYVMLHFRFPYTANL